MDTRKIQCREHGGYFEIPLKRGRPPVKCSSDNQCDAVTAKRHAAAKGIAQAVSRTLKGEMPRKVAVRVAEETGTVTTTQPTHTAVREQRRVAGRTNLKQATISKATAMREQLESQGWAVSGKGFSTEDSSYQINVVAVRGEELITAVWTNGQLAEPMHYSLWATDKPSKNGKPNSKLSFDPDEIPDNELAELLHGMKVTWWNRLGGKQETAIVSPDKVTIEHIFNGKGDETPGERIIKFVEHEGSGFRAFRLDALLKVG